MRAGVGKDLETDAPMEKVTTENGKVLEGVVLGLTVATAIDNSPAMFSLGSGAVQYGQVVGTVTQGDADQAISNAFRCIARGVQGIEFHVVPTFSALQADVLAEATEQKVTAAKGVFSNGRVFLILDSRTTQQELQETVFHELYGYTGVQKLFGQHATTMLDQHYRNIGGMEVCVPFGH